MNDNLKLMIEADARAIGRMLKEGLDKNYGPEQVGFTLFLYTYGENGWTTYLSSARREDMIKMLLAFIQKQQMGQVDELEGRN